MRFSVPHPIPYQGSKRRLAAAILSHIPHRQYTRLVEPFAGSAAVTLAAASREKFAAHVIGDALLPLVELWKAILTNPSGIADQYEAFWLRERRNPIDAYYEIRTEFNSDQSPAKLLYLLARCVKNAVRFNPSGDFNQSPDKRRTGTQPHSMRAELHSAHRLLTGRCEAVHTDFLSLFEQARQGDFFYLDPPYQGTSNGRDQRYIGGVSRKRMIDALELLNDKQIPFILSYDGSCGDKLYADPLPESIAHQTLLDVGRSSQATLNGRADVTIESLYLSHAIRPATARGATLFLQDFDLQPALF